MCCGVCILPLVDRERDATARRYAVPSARMRKKLVTSAPVLSGSIGHIASGERGAMSPAMHTSKPLLSSKRIVVGLTIVAICAALFAISPLRAVLAATTERSVFMTDRMPYDAF